MLLGFKRRFGHYVWEGSKTHTIRAERRDGSTPKIGETLFCFVDPRQAGMARLGNWRCSAVEPIVISESLAKPKLEIFLGERSRRLDEGEADLFVWRDGFRNSFSRTYSLEKGCHNFQVFCAYWRAQAKGARALPFGGRVIHWHFDAPLIPANSKALGRPPLPAIYGYACWECGMVNNRFELPLDGLAPKAMFCLNPKCGAALIRRSSEIPLIAEPLEVAKLKPGRDAGSNIPEGGPRA
jgi:hypothetical protein